MFETYKNIDLDVNPCVFPACGHLLIMETMDGHVGIQDHYDLDQSGLACRTKVPEDTLDVVKTKIICPECRRSLCDIPRYGRVIHRALLILSTLKFVSWSNAMYVSLAQQLLHLQEELETRSEEAREIYSVQSIRGLSTDQTYVLSHHYSKQPRYANLMFLRKQIQEFSTRVHKSEQPFKRVQEPVNHSRSSRRTEQHFDFDPSVLQTRAYILAEALLLRCDIIILSDVIALCSGEFEIAVDFSADRKSCETLFATAEQGGHVLQQTESQLFWARFAALEVCWASKPHQKFTSHHIDLRAQAENYLPARELCTTFPGQTRAISRQELGNVEKMLHESTFYAPVTDEEMRKVVAAMAQEFRGTGHWYRCANGHPFTIGECGGPMQETRCPQCGAPVGGQHHMAAEGVTRAADLEEAFGQMRV